MISNILTKHWEYKANLELRIKASKNKQIENKKILDTMLTLASIGELTPERYGFFMEIISNQKIGDNNVQKHLFNLSSERRDYKK